MRRPARNSCRGRPPLPSSSGDLHAEVLENRVGQHLAAHLLDPALHQGGIVAIHLEMDPRSTLTDITSLLPRSWRARWIVVPADRRSRDVW